MASNEIKITRKGKELYSLIDVFRTNRFGTNPVVRIGTLDSLKRFCSERNMDFGDRLSRYQVESL